MITHTTNNAATDPVHKKNTVPGRLTTTDTRHNMPEDSSYNTTRSCMQ